ncbi:hypothetical protein BDK92_7579 [Micromonospora pisi]|uniref:Uncharacterized protein n=1 Tax=Micromonospora pisi TaxID=589240 RepID=A0A495JW26_9ACTN|nr:hypothetical protein BDK92_7579 [Micromonospora pisi]
MTGIIGYAGSVADRLRYIIHVEVEEERYSG